MPKASLKCQRTDTPPRKSCADEYSRLTVSLRAIVRNTKHLTVRLVCRATLGPGRDVINVHVLKRPDLRSFLVRVVN